MSPVLPARAVQHADRVLARGVALLLLGLYVATFTGLPDVPDAEVEFQTTSALVRTQRLALSGTPEAAAIVEQGFAVHEGGPGREGRFYSWFGLGQALAAVPLYAAGAGLARLFPEIEARHAADQRYGAPRSEYFAHLLVGLRNPLLGAMTAALVLLTARRLGVGRRAALAAALTYGLASFAWPQARSTLSDVQATFFLFAAFHLLLCVRERYEGRAGPSVLELAGLGGALGGAFLTRVLTAPAVLVLLVATLLVVRWGRRRMAREGGSDLRGVLRDLSIVALPAALALALFLGANRVRFGSWLETGYSAGVTASFFGYPLHFGLAGLVAAPGKGLLWLAPLLLLLPAGVARARARRRTLWIAATAGIAVAVFVPVALTATWHGAWTYGPRYVLPALPFLWLAVALALNDVRHERWIGPCTGFLVLCGLLTNLPGVLVDHMTHEDLALSAARVAWPDPGGDDEVERDHARFLALQWDWRFAAPWAHWRILRSRIANGQGPDAERFPMHELFFVGEGELLTPEHARDRGFRHFAWVDFVERLGGAWWIGVVIVGGLLASGVVLLVRGSDRTLP